MSHKQYFHSAWIFYPEIAAGSGLAARCLLDKTGGDYDQYFSPSAPTVSAVT